MYTDARCARQDGLTLIEMIVFIVILGIGIAGILSVMDLTTRNSSDPLIRKQALAIAESLLEEIQLQPFTYCDPDDPDAATASNAGACAVALERPGPEAVFAPGQGATESRYSSSAPFDNVNDYDGLTMTVERGGILDISGASTGLSAYAAAVSVTPLALAAAGGAAAIDAAAALLIRVTVTGPDRQPLVLEGLRTRYAPNALP